METVGISRAWSLSTTISTARGREVRNGGFLFSSRSRSSLQISTPCICRGRSRSRLSEKKKDYYGGVSADFERARFGGVQGSFSKRQRRESRCRSSDESHFSGVHVVSEEEVEIHRKELLQWYWDEYWEDGFEDGIISETDNEAEDEDESVAEGQEDNFITRRAAARTSLYTALASEEESQPEKIYWWMPLAVNVRRIFTPRTKGILLLNVLTFLYGSNISIVKSAGETVDPTLFSVGRFAIASLAFTPFLNHALTSKKLRNASIELGLLASAGYLTQCVSVLTSDAARVSFISTFTVIVVPLLAGLSGAKISKITWIAAATALIGVGILESSGAPFAIGDVWSFVSAVTFGVHLLRTEHHSKSLAREDSLPVMSLQLVLITMCSGVWFGASHFKPDEMVISLSTSNWTSMWENAASLPWVPMLYTGLLSTAFCLWTELVTMRNVKATEAAVIYTTEPLWGAAFAWLILGERWGPNGWLGASFILGGSLTMQLFGNPDTTLSPKKIVLLPSSLDLVDRGDSFVEKEQLLIISETRDVSIEAHTQNLKARKPVRASRRAR